MKLRSPITMPGGKYTMLKHLLPLLDPRDGEQSYIEPFVGSGVVILNKQRHASEVINDIDGEIVNLLRILASDEGAMRLHWQLIRTPVERAGFVAAIDLSIMTESAIDRAARLVVSMRQSFGGTNNKGNCTDRNWGFSREIDGGVNSQFSRWASALFFYPAIQARLFGVIIDSQHAVRMIKNRDSSDALIYADPPYYGTEHYYNEGKTFGLDDHRALAETLNACKARVVLSYMDCPEVLKWYPESRWTVRRVTRNATLCGVNVSKASARRVELILTRG